MKLNWVPGRPDHRRAEYQPMKRTLAPAVLPLTGFFPVWDQGQEGSCTGHGNGALATHRIHEETGNLFMPSRQFLYYNERYIEGDVKQDGGAIVGDGMKAIEKWGICEEVLWPYSKKFSTKPSKAAYAAALAHLGLQSQTVPATVEALKAAIDARNPLSGGFTVYESFMRFTNGIMPMPSRKEAIEGGHCVCWDGYDDAKAMFWCRNSWGVNWGLKGWFMMPYEYIKKGCSDFHVLLKIK